MKFTARLTASCLALVLTSANAGTENVGSGRTVQNLYEDCKSEIPANQAVCQRYLQGVLHTLWIGGAFFTAPRTTDEARHALDPVASCGIGKTTGGEMRRIFIKWAEENPKVWHAREAVGAWAAMHEAWACMPPWPFIEPRIPERVLTSSPPPDVR